VPFEFAERLEFSFTLWALEGHGLPQNSKWEHAFLFGLLNFAPLLPNTVGVIEELRQFIDALQIAAAGADNFVCVGCVRRLSFAAWTPQANEFFFGHAASPSLIYI
jgi:hypothetical protein